MYQDALQHVLLAMVAKAMLLLSSSDEPYHILLAAFQVWPLPILTDGSFLNQDK
jgi:hypothetical protein